MNDDFEGVTPDPPRIATKKRKKKYEVPESAAAEPLPFELTPTEAPAIVHETIEKALAWNLIEQRPNSVIRNGGPHLLRGLMLPLCPSSNGYWRSMPTVRKGTQFPLYIPNYKAMFSKIRATTFPTDEAKDYIATIKEMAIQRQFRFMTDKDLRIDILVCPRDRRELDPHNYEKVVLDALQEAQVYNDDAQVKDCRTRLGPIIKGGRLVISLWEIKYNPDEAFKDAWR